MKHPTAVIIDELLDYYDKNCMGINFWKPSFVSLTLPHNIKSILNSNLYFCYPYNALIEFKNKN